MTKIETPEFLTEEQANIKFYPNSYIMTKCIREDKILKGYVVAYSPLNLKSMLLDYATELYRSVEYGLVIITDTKDPLGEKRIGSEVWEES